MRFKEYLSEQNWSVSKSATSDDFEIVEAPVKTDDADDAENNEKQTTE